MKQQSIFDALVKLSKKNAPEEAAEELPPPLHPRDRRSARARAAHARQRRAVARWKAKKAPSRFAPKKVWRGLPPPGASVLDRIVRAMEPGKWYAVSDLRHLAGLTRNEFLGVRLFSHGYLTRLRNPDWKRWEVPPRERQPYWLYTLTPVGRGRQRELGAR